MRKPLVAGLAALAAPLPALAQTGNGQMPYGPGHMSAWGGMGGWFMGPMMMLLFLVVAVVAVVVVVRLLARDTRPRGGGTGGDRSLEILRERYARGEIDEEEYAARRRTLEG
jgi:putative membrane protein